TIENSGLIHHGADTSGTGARYSEVYNNTFVWNPNGGSLDLPPNENGFIGLRGGTSLIHDNVIPNIISGAWGDKSEVMFTDENLRRNAGPYPCWGTTTPGSYPSPRQVGWGYTSGGTQAGSTGVYQDLEPVYLWNNTGTGNYNNPPVADYAPN